MRVPIAKVTHNYSKISVICSHNRCEHDDIGSSGGDKCICDRRNWRFANQLFGLPHSPVKNNRSAPRSRNNNGYICRPHRARPHPRDRSFIGRQIHTRYPENIGSKSTHQISKVILFLIVPQVLETYGVPVVGFRTEEFPGFFTNITGCKSPSVVGSPDEVAKMMLASRNLQLVNGMLVAVPNPSPAADQAEIAKCISSALLEAHNRGIRGAAVTPFLLAEG